MHDLKRGRVDRIAAEITQEIGVFLEDNNVNASAG